MSDPNPRPHLDPPHNLPLETPLGTVSLTVRDRDAVDIDAQGQDRALMLRGTPYAVALRLKRDAAGDWVPYPNATIYISRWVGLPATKKSVGMSSQTISAEIVSAIVPAVSAWAEFHPETLAEAHRVALNNRARECLNLLARTEREIGELQILAAAWRGELDKIEREERSGTDE